MSAIKTVADVLAIMADVGVPCQQANHTQQSSTPNEPYAVLVPGEHHELLTADGYAHEYRSYDLQVYTKRRDLALERLVTSALRAAGILVPMPEVTLPTDEVPAAVAYYPMSLTE